MPAYILKMTGAIRYKRRNVGRVTQANGLWVAVIGQHRFESADKSTAFREVVALACGFPNAGTMRQHNAGIRRQNAATRAAVRAQWASVGARSSRPSVPSMQPSGLSDEELVMVRQREMAEMGETPLTADQILSTWRRL